MATYLRQVQRLRMSGAFIPTYLLMTCVGTALIHFTARTYI
jgi:hypothetical protein